VPAETQQEKQVWTLLVENFRWDRLDDFGVRELVDAEGAGEPARFQIFEVIVAAIFAELCPDYDWYVTPNSADGGLDFWGSKSFLKEPTLGIDAVVSVAGQCKKRGKIEQLVRLLGGDLMLMEHTASPTFFFVALSSRVSRERIEKAREVLEYGRKHCHILDRGQIEGLMHDHSSPVERVLLASSLSSSQVKDVLSYLASYNETRLADLVSASVPGELLAGEPFSVSIDVRLPLVRAAGLRFGWRPPVVAPSGREIVVLDPIEADSEKGAPLALSTVGDDPMGLRRSLELLTYAIGEVDLGEVVIGQELGAGTVHRIPLGSVRVGENMRPRFYVPPFRSVLAQLVREHDRARAAGVKTIGIVGAGGSGKSRVCEEFSLRQRRQGCAVLVARQAKTIDDPHRLLADLFRGLAGDDFDYAKPAESVIEVISAYDANTAENAEAALRAIFGTADQHGDSVTNQSVLAALVVLLVARGNSSPLIVHLQDLHWCDVDTLMLLEKLVWRLEGIYSSEETARRAKKGILILLEGRIHERGSPREEDWSSGHFEAFLRKIDGPTAVCSSFDPSDGLEFVRLLFADSYSGNDASGELRRLQDELIERIFRSAGGNPFHSLEQVRFLKESGVLGQNERTGFLYLVKPEIGRAALPERIFDLIKLRWQYLRDRRPELALLIWAVALLEDRIPTPLFRRLREEIAPDLSLTDIDATDILWTGAGQEPEVAFRHEHYFRSIRRFEVAADDRERVICLYSEWLSGKRNPVDRFRRARALRKLPDPDIRQVQTLMRSALSGARKRGDQPLAQRIAATSLDIGWERDLENPMRTDVFLHRADEELELTRELLSSDRSLAAQRLRAMSRRLDARLVSAQADSPEVGAELQHRQLTAEILKAQLLYNDGRPAMAAEGAARAVDAIRALRVGLTAEDDRTWESLEMEALFSQASALALSGEIDAALEVSSRAVAIARRCPSETSWRVISTYANILLARDPAASESILRELLESLPAAAADTESRHATQLNLGMALLLRAYNEMDGENGERTAVLGEARELLNEVFRNSYRVGQYPRAGAAAMIRGILGALDGDGEEINWFGQAVAAASRGHKVETLWRAHINFATAIYRSSGEVTDEVRDQARAALEILEETLAPYAQPDASPRFELVRVPLAQAVRYLIVADDEAGRLALVNFPTLRESFADIEAGLLRDDRGVARRSHEWLRIGGEDYVIY
jgi:hypothetical protein